MIATENFKKVGAEKMLDRFAPWIIFAAVLMFCLPIFSRMDGFAGADAKRQSRALGTLYEFEHARMALVEFGGPALWSPYCDGGYPAIKNPTNLAFSPLIIPALVFGSLVGLKILIVFATWIGAWGVFLLARRFLKLRAPGAFFSALAFAFSGWLPALALQGQPNILLMMSPIVMYLALGASTSPSKIAGAGLILGLLILSGPHLIAPLLYFLIITSAFFYINHTQVENTGRLRINLVALALLVFVSLPLSFNELVPAWIRVCVALGFAAYLFELSLTRNLIRPCAPALIAVGVILVISFGVGYGRIGSSLELIRDAKAWKLVTEGPFEEREVEEKRPDEFYTLTQLAKSINGKKQAEPSPDKVKSTYGYLGITWPVFLCFAAGAYVYRRRFASFLLSLFIAALICLGPNLPLDFHHLFVRGIPFFDLVHDPFKHFSFFIVFFMALMSGGAVDWVLAKINRRWLQTPVIVGAFLILVFPFLCHRAYYRSAYEVSLPKLERAGDFYWTAPAPVDVLENENWPVAAAYKEIFFRRKAAGVFAFQDRYQYKSLDPMLNMLRHTGTMDCPQPFELAIKTEPRYWVMPDDSLKPYAHYRGEAYFYEAQNKVLGYRIAGNALSYEVDVKQGGLLTVNQNYDKDFTVHSGELTESGGKLAALLPEPGRYTVKFVYRPTKVILRFCISGLLCLILSAYLALPLVRKRRK